MEKIRVLLADHDYAVIAAKLNEEGFRTAKGLPRLTISPVGYVALELVVGTIIGANQPTETNTQS